MPGLSEDVIRQITERVTREVLAALDATPQDVVVDEWPDYDEFPEVPFAAEAETQVSVEVPSRLRLASRGEVAPLPEDDEPDEPYTVDMPMPTPSAGGGFQPTDNWLAAQLARMPKSYLSSRPPGAALEAWAEVG